MFDSVVLDAGPLGMIAHRAPKEEVLQWLDAFDAAGVVMCVPEIADYEVRRGLIQAGLWRSLERLNWLRDNWAYLPITTSAMDAAAELWAAARQRGLPSAVRDALDGDVILAAQTQLYLGTGRVAVVATTNVLHLNRYIDARHWSDISPA